MEWTTESVKVELPDVPVMFKRGRATITINCVVRGRKMDFATVRPFDFGSAVEWQFSWSAIADALNSGRALRV